jgi:hypothetical protein
MANEGVGLQLMDVFIDKQVIKHIPKYLFYNSLLIPHVNFDELFIKSYIINVPTQQQCGFFIA